MCIRQAASSFLATDYPLPTLATRHSPLPLCFHILTNPFSRNSFTFTSIQNPGGVGGFSALYLATRHSFTPIFAGPLATSPLLSSTCPPFRSLFPPFRPPVLCFQSFADSFCKTPGVGGYQL